MNQALEMSEEIFVIARKEKVKVKSGESYPRWLWQAVGSIELPILWILIRLINARRFIPSNWAALDWDEILLGFLCSQWRQICTSILYLERRWASLLSSELISVCVEQKALRRLGKEKFGVTFGSA